MAARNGTSFNRLVIEDQLKTSSKQVNNPLSFLIYLYYPSIIATTIFCVYFQGVYNRKYFYIKRTFQSKVFTNVIVM